MSVKNEREKSKVSFGLLFFDKEASIDFLLSSVCLFLSRRFSVRFVLFAFDDCFALLSSSLLRSQYVVVLALSREVLFRARALLLEKKRISIDYRRLCGLLPETKEKDDVINTTLRLLGARLSNKKSSLFEKKNDDA